MRRSTGGAKRASGYTVDVLTELPFITAEDIAAEYRPGAKVGVKSAMRTLRGKGIVSDGLAVRSRGQGGRMVGSGHLYSALNVDAVQLYRRGDEKGAKELAKRAAKLERRKDVKALALALGTTYSRHGVLYRAIGDLMNDETRTVVRAVAEETEAERQQLTTKFGLRVPTFGRVCELHGDLAELRLEETGKVMHIPKADLWATDASLGACVALHWEPLGKGLTLLKAGAALDLDDDRKLGSTYPYSRALPADNSRVDLTDVLSTNATIRRPRRVSIGGSK